MSFLTRKRYKLPHPGPWVGVITNHLDPTYMGGLEVSLIKSTMGELELQNETVVVRHMTPFYGVTPISAEGTNSSDFNDVQKSYGMWFVPPDLGTRVMCIFVDGDPNQGYWIGCVPDQFQNHMVPGIASSKASAMTAEQEKKYGTRNVPVGEFLKKGRDLSIGRPDDFTKPIHPFADRLLAQGLLTDTIRGGSSSSARREVPSAVFGISTPGPLDKTGKKGYIGYGKVATAPVSRLGGSSFVMDDGDKDGQNELVRIRTRTGHQILLHNSQDLIYIANSKGSAWIELTSNGKIDIFAEDSISIHTEQDFNFRADRDINLEAGRDLKISVGRNMQTEVTKDLVLVVSRNGFITYSGTLDHSVDSDAVFSYGTNLHVGAGGSIFNTATKNHHVTAGSNIFETAVGTMNLKSGGNMLQSTGATFNVGAVGLYLATASDIHLNGPAAASAKSATAADSATIPSALPRYYLPNRQKNSGWDDGKFYKADDLNSIMKRIPTHEPWDHHENVNKSLFEPTLTDTDAPTPTKKQKQSGTGPVSPVVQSPGEAGRGTQGTANPSAPISPPVPNLNRANMPSDWTKDLDFYKKVKVVATELKCSHIDLLCCMAFETGRTMNPALQNSIRATGLIQFLPVTAEKVLDTTVEYLATLTRVQQMDWVLKYFKKGPIAKLSSVTLEDLYMAILWPAAVGKPDSYILFSEPSKSYEQNKGLDKNKDGNITKAEAAAKVRDQLNYIRGQLLKIPDEGGVWTDSSGNPILSGDGSPVRYGPYPPVR
jgi:uncharacterized protein (DUF2345 family)